MSFSILVLASDGGAVPAPAGFTEAAAVSYTTTWGEAVAQIARDDVDLLALTPDASCVKGLVEWCDEHEVERALLVGREPEAADHELACCLLYTSPSPRDKRQSRMPSSA